VSRNNEHPHDYRTALLASVSAINYGLFSIRWEFEHGKLSINEYTEATKPMLEQQIKVLEMLRETER